MIFRLWKAEDNLRVFELEKACFKSPWSLEMIDSAVTSSNFYGLVCEIENVVQGYIGVAFDPFDSQVLNLAVSSEFRRKGIADKLLEMIAVQMKNMGKENLFLEVRVSNYSAISLYQKHNFYEIGRRQKYYENTEDAIVMAKVL